MKQITVEQAVAEINSHTGEKTLVMSLLLSSNHPAYTATSMIMKSVLTSDITFFEEPTGDTASPFITRVAMNCIDLLTISGKVIRVDKRRGQGELACRYFFQTTNHHNVQVVMYNRSVMGE